MKRKNAELQAVLSEFYEYVACARSREERVALLRTAAKVRVFTGFNDPSGEEVRASWNRRVRRGGSNVAVVCFACRKARKTVTHHVVQLQNGGTNQRLNRVSVCRQCHAKIHPWLLSARSRAEQEPA